MRVMSLGLGDEDVVNSKHGGKSHCSLNPAVYVCLK